MIAGMICKLARHRVNRRVVWFDGTMYRTRCCRCHASLVRGAKGWTTHVENASRENHSQAAWDAAARHP